MPGFPSSSQPYSCMLFFLPIPQFPNRHQTRLGLNGAAAHTHTYASHYASSTVERVCWFGFCEVNDRRRAADRLNLRAGNQRHATNILGCFLFARSGSGTACSLSWHGAFCLLCRKDAGWLSIPLCCAFPLVFFFPPPTLSPRFGPSTHPTT